MRNTLGLALTITLLGCGAPDGGSTEHGAQGGGGPGGEAGDTGSDRGGGDSSSGMGAGGSDEGPADRGPIAEVPFAATEIRDATPAGRTYVFRFREGDATRYERWVFETVNATGFTRTSTPVDEAGQPTGPAVRSEGTWRDLEAHAHFPLDQTEIGRARLTLPVGAFACRLYTVTSEENGRPVVQRFWFAVELPGAPVRMAREVAGETVVEMQLMAHEPPIAQ